MVKENVLTCQKVKSALLFALLSITVITCIHIPEWIKWRDLLLQHIGTLLLVIPLLYDTVKNRMPLFAFVGVTLFAILHVVGARYSYSYVPYREWSVSYLCVSADYWGAPANYLGNLTDFFDAHNTDLRNHYDRLVHFSFGLFMFSYLLHISRKWVDRNPLAAVFVAWLLVQTGSMVYEIIEWQLAVHFSPETAEKYNGQQGDVWDAQKDMLLAMIGSTIMAVFYAIWDKCKRKKMFVAAYAAILLLCGLLVWVGTGGMRCSFEDCAKMKVKKSEQMHDHAEKEKRGDAIGSDPIDTVD